jgi:predicted dehydrogenase
MTKLFDRRDVLKWALGAASLGVARAFPNEPPIRIAVSDAGERGSGLLRLLAADEKWRVVTRFDDAEIVLNVASPRNRAAVSLAALRTGKHVITELPAALTLEDCQSLVDACEQAERHCFLFESGCYTVESLFVLGLFSAGLLGDALFAETGFCHTLATTENSLPGMTLASRALAPVGWYMNIHRGDRVRSVTALHSAFVQNALLATEQGRTIALSQNTATPRPDEGLVRIQGTKGVYSGMRHGLYVDGRSPDSEVFEPLTGYKEYEPKLLRNQAAAADALCLYRIARSLRHGPPPDCDVYDAATWSAIPLLAAQSAEKRSEPVECPDFTRGQWPHRAPVRAERMF